MDDKKRRYDNEEPFGFLMKPLNQFFQEKPIRGFLQQIDELFKNPLPFGTSFHVNLSETEIEYIIQAELPGVNREQIQIDVLERYITILVQSSELVTEEDENRSIVRRQQSFQSSSRTIPLAQPINEKNVKASYENGLLQIKAPKQKGKKIYLD